MLRNILREITAGNFGNMEFDINVIEQIVGHFKALIDTLKESDKITEEAYKKLSSTLDEVSRKFKVSFYEGFRAFEDFIKQLNRATKGLEVYGNRLQDAEFRGFQRFANILKFLGSIGQELGAFGELQWAGTTIQKLVEYFSMLRKMKGVQGIGATIGQAGAIAEGAGAVGTMAGNIGLTVATGAIVAGAVVIGVVKLLDKITEFVASAAKTITERGYLGIQAYARAAWTEQAKMAITLQGANLALSKFGMSLSNLAGEMDLMSRTWFETVEGIKMAGMSGRELAKASQELYTRTLPVLAFKMKAVEMVTGMSAEAMNSLRQSLLKLTTNLGTTWDSVMNFTGMLFARYKSLIASMEQFGISFDEYTKWITNMAESARFFGININTSTRFVEQFADRLKAGIISVEEVTNAFKELLGQTSIEGQLKRIVGGMLFGPPEFRELINRLGGPLQAIPYLNIITSTAWQDLSRTERDLRRAGQIEAANFIRSVMTMFTQQDYQRFQIIARELVYQAFGGIANMFRGPLSMLMAPMFSQAFFGASPLVFSPTESAARAAAVTYAGTMLARAPVEPIRATVALSDKDKLEFQKMMTDALTALEQRAGIIKKLAGIFGEGLFGPDFINALRRARE
jgi:hypothetical protein